MNEKYKKPCKNEESNDMRNIVASMKIALFIAISIILIIPQLLVLAFTKGKISYILPQLWHKALCAIFNIKINYVGKPSTNGQTIFVSNHMSYLDIMALGTVLRASFVSKKDVASWPVLGFLSKLQQTVFISRSHTDAKKEKYTLDNVLDEGKDLIIFPEGTSTDGRTVIPFKSSLFSIAVKEGRENLFIQPITLALHNVENHEIKTQEDYDLYSWHINMITPLGEHLWKFLSSKGAELYIYFHPPIRTKEYSDRKVLAKACYKTVSNGLTDHKQKQNYQI